MNYNLFISGVYLGYFILGLLTASFIGSIGCGIWLLLNKEAAKFYVKDAMKYLKLVLMCYVLPMIPFIIYPFFKNTSMTSGAYLIKPMVKVLMIIMSMWALFVIGQLIYRFVCYLHICKICEDSIPIEDEEILRQLDKWKRHLKIKRRVKIFMNPNVSSPAILYHWGYQVLLPAHEMTEQEIAMVLLHELVHLKHNDIFIKDVCFVVYVMHGLNPFIRYIKRHIVKWAEVLCDLTTCDVGKELFSRQEYYYGIVGLMENVENDRNPEGFFSLAESKSLLKFRVDKFAEANKQVGRRLKGLLYIVLFFMVIVTSLVLGSTVGVTNQWYETSLEEREEVQSIQKGYKSLSYDQVLAQISENQDLIYREAYSFVENFDSKKVLEKDGIWFIHIEEENVEVLDLHVFTNSTDYTIGYVNQALEVTCFDEEGVISVCLEDVQGIEYIYIKNNSKKVEFDVAATVRN